ncbi:MAG: trypsin-like peptidase domain-containing protein [Pirellulales bacterium]
MAHRIRQSDVPPEPWEVIRPFVIGLALVGIALIVSALLAGQQLGWFELPGCGAGSRCAGALDGTWGRLAGWPVPFMGVAYFAGLTLQWGISFPGRMTVSLRWFVRAGAAASLLLLLVMLLSGGFSIYFVVVHAANLGFWSLVERTRLAHAPSWWPVIAASATLVLVSSLFDVVVAEQRRSDRERRDRLAARDATGMELGRNAYAKPRGHGPTVATGAGQHEADGGDARPAGPAQDDPPAAGRVEGGTNAVRQRPAGPRREGQPAGEPRRRTHRIGPDDAETEIVVFFDYASPLYGRLEPRLRKRVAEQKGKLALLLRHFPLCTDCNLSIRRTEHPNACRAARAAEAAAILKGNAGFLQMHDWLLKRRGKFTDPQLDATLRQLGYHDLAEFRRTMESERAEEGIVEDGVEAGIYHVRMVPTIVAHGAKLEGPQAERVFLLAELKAKRGGEATTPDAAPHPSSDRSPPWVRGELPDRFPPAIVQRAMTATVAVTGPQGRWVASGVVVGVRQPFVYVLTAWHTVARSPKIDVTTFSVDTYPATTGGPYVAAVIAQAPRADVALLRFTTDDAMPGLLPICRPDRVPNAKGLVALSVGCDRGRPTVQSETVVDKKQVRIRDDAPSAWIWEVEGEVAHGRSGGPLVDARGCVLGIASGASQGKGYFAHTDEIMRMLREHGLAWLVGDN